LGCKAADARGIDDIREAAARQAHLRNGRVIKDTCRRQVMEALIALERVYGRLGELPGFHGGARNRIPQRAKSTGVLDRQIAEPRQVTLEGFDICALRAGGEPHGVRERQLPGTFCCGHRDPPLDCEATA
jgi:hypothetical protein